MRQKRPTDVDRPQVCVSANRDLFMWQTRPIDISIPAVRRRRRRHESRPRARASRLEATCVGQPASSLWMCCDSLCFCVRERGRAREREARARARERESEGARERESERARDAKKQRLGTRGVPTKIEKKEINI